MPGQVTCLQEATRQGPTVVEVGQVPPLVEGQGSFVGQGYIVLVGKGSLVIVGQDPLVVKNNAL